MALGRVGLGFTGGRILDGRPHLHPLLTKRRKKKLSPFHARLSAERAGLPLRPARCEANLGVGAEQRFAWRSEPQLGSGAPSDGKLSHGSLHLAQRELSPLVSPLPPNFMGPPFFVPPGARGRSAPKPRAPQSPSRAAPQTQRACAAREGEGPSDSEPLRADGESYHGAGADSGALHRRSDRIFFQTPHATICKSLTLTAKAAAFSGRGGAAAAAVTSKACRSHNQAANVAL